jgi:hypothetical protein
MLIAARSSQDFCLLLIMTRDHESMLEVFFSFRNIRLGQHQRRPCLNCSRFQLLERRTVFCAMFAHGA